MHGQPIAAGKSSFDLIEPEKVFAALSLKQNSSFLDIACGVGNYTLAAAEYIGDSGNIYAVDLWEEGVAALKREIDARKLENVTAMLGDVGKKLELEDNCIDVCLMATVLHDLIEVKLEDGALAEAARVLRPGGTLAVIEFKKIEPPPGPPIHVRISPDELNAVVAPYDFRARQNLDVGPYNYLTIFAQKRA